MAKPLLLINGRFLTQPITGVQRYATEVILAITRLQSDYRLIVATPKRKINPFPYLEQDYSTLPGHAWEQIRLPWLVKKYKADLLWCPGNTAPVIKGNVPLLVNIYDSAIFSGPEWFSVAFRLFYQKLIPRIGKISDRIVTCSKFSKKELVKYNIAQEAKIDVIYGAINHLDKQFNEDKMDGLGDLAKKIKEKPYILFLGSRDPRKNLNRLLCAWDRLAPEEKRGKVLVVTGGQSAAFAKEKALEIMNDVIFLGYVPDCKLPALYRQAEAFVFPSLYEGFGLPPLEAMACVTPTLVSKGGSLPEVCGDAALYCDPYSVQDIAEKMARLANDPDLRARLREKGKKQVQKFSWEESARKHLKVIDELVRN